MAVGRLKQLVLNGEIAGRVHGALFQQRVIFPAAGRFLRRADARDMTIAVPGQDDRPVPPDGLRAEHGFPVRPGPGHRLDIHFAAYQHPLHDIAFCQVQQRQVGVHPCALGRFLFVQDIRFVLSENALVQLMHDGIRKAHARVFFISGFLTKICSEPLLDGRVHGGRGDVRRTEALRRIYDAVIRQRLQRSDQHMHRLPLH